MQINHLKISNFRALRGVDLRDLTPTTILTGGNGVGKTTILDALRVLFIGHTYDQEGKRITNEDLCGPHGDKAEIVAGLRVEDDTHGGKSFNVCLTIKKNGQTSIKIHDDRMFEVFPGVEGVTKLRAALHDFMGVDPRHLECALNPRAYLLGPELGNILAELCCGEISVSDIREACGEHWETVEFLADLNVIEINADNLTAIGDAAYKRRTQTNKIIAVAEKTVQDLAGVQQPTDTKGNPLEVTKLSALKAALSDLTAKRDALIAERGRTEGPGSLESIKARSVNLATDVNRLKTDQVVMQEKHEKAEAANKEAERVYGLAVEGVEKIEDQHRAAASRASDAVKALESLNGSDGACPTCSRKYTAALREKLIAPLESEKATAEAEFAKLDASLTDAKTKLEEHKATKDKAYSDYMDTANALRMIVSDLAVAERELKALPDPASFRSAEEITTEIEAIDARIEKGREKIHDLERWHELEIARENLSESAELLTHLEWIIRAFRDGEFVKDKLGDTKHRFEDKCNAKLDPFGYQLEIAIEGKHVRVYLTKGDEKPSPLSQCSKAELVLAGWAVSTAFANGAPVCLDDLDAMSGPNKTAFLSDLKKHAGELPVFVSDAWTANKVDLDPIKSFLPDASVVWVQDAPAAVKEVAA